MKRPFDPCKIKIMVVKFKHFIKNQLSELSILRSSSLWPLTVDAIMWEQFLQDQLTVDIVYKIQFRMTL